MDIRAESSLRTVPAEALDPRSPVRKEPSQMPESSSARRVPRVALALAATLLLFAAACSSSSDDTATSDTTAPEAAASGATPAGATCDKTITLGYSAWPGWFPWAIADEKGLFEENGVDVDMRFFSDYIASLDALVAGEIDGNSQTLNDTMLGVASGSEQVIVLVNDNSTGNDAIIVDESIASIEDLRGKTVAAEPGVVDHFLLLQGLASMNMTQADIDFRGLPNADAAAAFAGGEFDAVGVYAPATLTALERPGSKVLFSSEDYPGTIPDHLVLDPTLVAECPGDVQSIVNTWYATLDWIEANPEEARTIMAAAAELSPEEYAEFDAGTTLFTAEQALAAFQPGTDTTSLEYTATLINPFLVEAELIPEEADISGLFDPSFTQAYVDANS
jgi:NitT/TauT family transport system substrate-binding protein